MDLAYRTVHELLRDSFEALFYPSDIDWDLAGVGMN